MTDDRYPEELLDEDDDCGVMPENVATLAEAVVGHRIVSAEQRKIKEGSWRTESSLVLTLDDGREVQLIDTDDCCAYTALESFFLDPSAVDHIILGVGTTDYYSTWHIFADFGDVMKLELGWSCGNPFYYGYGFDINVIDARVNGAADDVNDGAR
jgi:hypothetical protein